MFSLKEFHLNPQQYVENLISKASENPNDTVVLTDLAEAFFEMGEAQRALPLIDEVIRLDPAGASPKVFLYAGQLNSGFSGLTYYDKAVKDLTAKLRELAAREEEKEDGTTVSGNKTEEYEEVASQLSQAKLGMIEIWMTDLCMEPKAESECERLIREAFKICDSDPEAWSVLGSIRISQIRQTEAKEALTQAWRLFSDAVDTSSVDNSVIPKLIRLAQSMAELFMVDEMLEITNAIQSMDDLVPELYYLNALAHKLSLNENQDPVFFSQHVIAARDAVELLLNLQNNPDCQEPVDEELLAAARDIMESLPEAPIEDPWKTEDGFVEVDGVKKLVDLQEELQ